MQAQQISLNYHCKCEQWVHFAYGGFFNFNGTAGEHTHSHIVMSLLALSYTTRVSLQRQGCRKALVRLRAKIQRCILLCFCEGVWRRKAINTAFRAEESCMVGAACPTLQYRSPSCCEGVWRRKAIDTAGGWNSRTTVEDMDLSLRAYLAGWKAIYLRHVTVLNEACPPPHEPLHQLCLL